MLLRRGWLPWFEMGLGAEAFLFLAYQPLGGKFRTRPVGGDSAGWYKREESPIGKTEIVSWTAITECFFFSWVGFSENAALSWPEFRELLQM